MPSGACFDAEDRMEAVLAALDLELSGGQAVVDFERVLSKTIGMRSSIACNFGSSANLLAFATLCDPSLDGHIEPGAEVVTGAVEFPTTVSPTLQYGYVPVIVDADPKTGSLDLEALEDTLGPGREQSCPCTPSAARIARTICVSLPTHIAFGSLKTTVMRWELISKGVQLDSPDIFQA